MIKLESAHIEEVRGIRKLDIDFQQGPFAISGPNGSGKSGVIDAIEFGLTGQIGRLTGRPSITGDAPPPEALSKPLRLKITRIAFPCRPARPLMQVTGPLTQVTGTAAGTGRHGGQSSAAR